MKFQMFFEFPGILITIGVLLLIISIIIIIIAYKSDNKDVDASKLSTHGLYKSTITHDGYYDNGKPKIIIEQNQSDINNKDNELDRTKVYTPLQQNKKEEKKAIRQGIKDQVEKIPIAEKPLFPKANIDNNSKNSIENLPIIDAFEEEFSKPSKKDFEKPKIKEAKKEDFTNPRDVQNKQEVKTVIKNPIYVEDDEDVELL